MGKNLLKFNWDIVNVYFFSLYAYWILKVKCVLSLREKMYQEISWFIMKRVHSEMRAQCAYQLLRGDFPKYQVTDRTRELTLHYYQLYIWCKIRICCIINWATKWEDTASKKQSCYTWQNALLWYYLYRDKHCPLW